MTSIARIVSLLTVAVLTLAIAPAADDLDAFIQAQMAQRQVNGLSIAIIQDGKIDARAFGVTARGGAPVTTATLFQAGSISKPVAAAGRAEARRAGHAFARRRREREAEELAVCRRTSSRRKKRSRCGGC